MTTQARALTERGVLYRLHDLLQGICTAEPCAKCMSGGAVALYDREADDRVEQALDLIEAALLHTDPVMVTAHDEHIAQQNAEWGAP